MKVSTYSKNYGQHHASSMQCAAPSIKHISCVKHHKANKGSFELDPVDGVIHIGPLKKSYMLKKEMEFCLLDQLEKSV
jgi:hypothetical protein